MKAIQALTITEMLATKLIMRHSAYTASPYAIKVLSKPAMNGSARLALHSNDILAEIATRAEGWEIEHQKLEQRDADELRKERDGDMVTYAAASWHIEGWDSARAYLEEWAPDALAALKMPLDSDLDAAFEATEMWDKCLLAAISGARRGLNVLLRHAVLTEDNWPYR